MSKKNMEDQTKNQANIHTPTIKKVVYGLLKRDNRLWNNEEFNETQLIHLVKNYDKNILSLLFKNKITKEKFFIEVQNVHVFKVNDFCVFIEENKLNNSYTKYKNTIGLTDGERFLKDTNDVVLNFPYKDCVLEGGMSTEDVKRDEIFFNEVLAQDEIDSLFDEKALVNWKKHTANGKHDFDGNFNRDENGTIKDNLIIKGNNLLTLHSLKKEFTGKVKLIYIDPPYNTDSNANTFKYNNRFNHSTWLTFMKNRLEIARELLRDDGIIIIDIDHFELFYLGILCDEIFKKENRIGVLAVQHNPGGRDNDFFANSHENKLVYAKSKSLAKIYGFPYTKKEIKDKFNKEDEKGKYYEMELQRTGDNSKRTYRPNLFYPIFYDKKTKNISLEYKPEFIKILPIDNNGIERRWRWSTGKVKKEWKTELVVKETNHKYKIYTKQRLDENTTKRPKTLWVESKHAGTSGTKAIKDIFGDKVFTYPKSPFMVKDSLLTTTKPNDLVLDFFLGSGTTAAVAHKMGRQYIGIEQMDYIEDIAVERIKKVIAGEQGGISKAVEWKGGGEFLYCELATWNEQAKKRISACKTTEELLTFFEKLCKTYFLNYNVEIEKFNKTESRNDFKKFSLSKQKNLLLEMLDLNQMYVLRSEMEDSKYKLNKQDVINTKEFYREKK